MPRFALRGHRASLSNNMVQMALLKNTIVLMTLQRLDLKRISRQDEQREKTLWKFSLYDAGQVWVDKDLLLQVGKSRPIKSGVEYIICLG